MDSAVTPEQLRSLLAERGGALTLLAAQWTDSPEDCLQEALIELAQQRSAPRNPVAWLFHVVRRRAIDMHRASQRRRKHEAAAGQALPSWFLPTDALELDGQAVAVALRELSLEHREVIVARIWGGLSFDQIGTLVGASTSAAHRRYIAGLQTLRERLNARLAY